MPKRDPLGPIHPGEILREEILVPMGMSAYAAAKAMGVPRTRIERLIREETPITADTALRLEKAFGSSAQFWLGLQSQFELDTARRRGDASIDAIPRLVA